MDHRNPVGLAFISSRQTPGSILGGGGGGGGGGLEVKI